MSSIEVGPGTPRRAAGVVLGGLAVGAVLGAGVAAQPAQAADDKAAPAADARADAPERGAGMSFQELFRLAFTPGALPPDPREDLAILIPVER